MTSSGAYKPDYTAAAAPKKTKKGGAADPFTGSGAYKPEPELSTRGGTGQNMARYIPGEATLPEGEKIEAVKGDMTTNPDRFFQHFKNIFLILVLDIFQKNQKLNLSTLTFSQKRNINFLMK